MQSVTKEVQAIKNDDIGKAINDVSLQLASRSLVDLRQARKARTTMKDEQTTPNTPNRPTAAVFGTV